MRFVICALLVFMGSFGLGKWMQQNKKNACSFEPTLYPIEDRSFVVVVIDRNNGAYVEKVLSSVFSQRYPNYRVIYVDDASDDGSFELAKELIGSRAVIFRNETILGKEESVAKIAAHFREDEILIVMQGYEWLAHEWVLARLNQYFAHPDLKVASSQFRQFPHFAASFEKGLLGFYASALQDTNFEELLEKTGEKHFANIPETFVIRQGL